MSGHTQSTAALKKKSQFCFFFLGLSVINIRKNKPEHPDRPSYLISISDSSDVFFINGFIFSRPAEAPAGFRCSDWAVAATHTGILGKAGFKIDEMLATAVR